MILAKLKIQPYVQVVKVRIGIRRNKTMTKIKFENLSTPLKILYCLFWFGIGWDVLMFLIAIVYFIVTM